jgi:hypothetical protein
MNPFIDFTINKAMSIAPRQFDSLKPGVSITLKGIPLDKFEEMYPHYEDIANNLFHFELIKEFVVYKQIQKDGLDNYCMDIIKNKIDKMSDKINNSIIEIMKVQGE